MFIHTILKYASDEIDKLEKRKKKHIQFIEHLEQIYEFLDDDRLKFEDVNEIKDSVEYYIDYNQDPEFVEDDLLFDGLYKKAEEAELAEELEFSDEEDENYDEEDDEYDEEEDEPSSPTSPRKRKISDPVPMVKKVDTPKKAEPVKKEQPPSPVKQKQPETPKKVEKAPEPVKPVATPVSVPVVTEKAQKPPIAPVKQTPPQEQPVKKDSKAKQAVAGSNLKVKVPPTQETVVNTNNATPKSAPVQPSTKQTQPTTPMTAVVDKNKVVPKIAPSPTVKQPLNQPTSNVVKSHVSYMDMVNKTQGAVTTPTSQPTVQINPTQKLSKPESVHMFDPSITGANSDVTILSSKDEELERSEPVSVPLPPSMGIEDFSFRTASTSPHLQQNVFTDADWKNQMLQGSLTHLPHVTDCERPRLYTPLNEFATPDYFPSQPAPILSDPSIFGSMDTDTLFFIFYFKQGTYQQYLAAKELKKQAWRYHKKYMTWFQRHDKPRHTTNEYELGTYVYFDYETGWCQRIKSGFRFEYQHLEDSN
jgi:CCR4-NOT transcription complex subunit 3